MTAYRTGRGSTTLEALRAFYEGNVSVGLEQRELLRLNSEFGAYVPEALRRPRVALRPFGDPEYFPIGVKHRYTRH
jgi:hypothetical protein